MGLEVPVSIIMLVRGVVPIEVSSFANCDSYSCSNNSSSFQTAVDNSWCGGSKVSGVTVSTIIFLMLHCQFDVCLFGLLCCYP